MKKHLSRLRWHFRLTPKRKLHLTAHISILSCFVRFVNTICHCLATLLIHTIVAVSISFFPDIANTRFRSELRQFDVRINFYSPDECRKHNELLWIISALQHTQRTYMCFEQLLAVRLSSTAFNFGNTKRGWNVCAPLVMLKYFYGNSSYTSCQRYGKLQSNRSYPQTIYTQTLTKVKKTISRIKCVAAWWVLLSARRVVSCRPDTNGSVCNKMKIKLYESWTAYLSQTFSCHFNFFLRLTEGRVASLMPKATMYFMLNECMRSQQAHLVAMFAFRLIRD